MPYQAQRAPRRSVCPAPVPRSSPVRPSSVPRPFLVRSPSVLPSPGPVPPLIGSTSDLLPYFVRPSSAPRQSFLCPSPSSLQASFEASQATPPRDPPSSLPSLCTSAPFDRALKAWRLAAKTMPPPPPPGPSESHRRLNETRQIEIKMEIALLLSGKSLFRAFRSIKKRE